MAEACSSAYGVSHLFEIRFTEKTDVPHRLDFFFGGRGDNTSSAQVFGASVDFIYRYTSRDTGPFAFAGPDGIWAIPSWGDLGYDRLGCGLSAGLGRNFTKMVGMEAKYTKIFNLDFG